MEKLYRVQMNKNGMPNFSTAEEVEPCKDDAIRRSDAIRAIEEEYKGDDIWRLFKKPLMDIPAVEPCKDAVSREWLLNELEEMNVASFYELNEHSKGAYEDMKRMLKAAPSVAPSRPSGEWVDSKGNPDSALHGIYCSQCGEYSEYRDYYCGNCGAKMTDKDIDVPNKLPMSAKHEAE